MPILSLSSLLSSLFVPYESVELQSQEAVSQHIPVHRGLRTALSSDTSYAWHIQYLAVFVQGCGCPISQARLLCKQRVKNKIRNVCEMLDRTVHLVTKRDTVNHRAFSWKRNHTPHLHSCLWQFIEKAYKQILNGGAGLTWQKHDELDPSQNRHPVTINLHRLSLPLNKNKVLQMWVVLRKIFQNTDQAVVLQALERYPFLFL